MFTHGNKRVNGEKFRERLSLSQLEDELNICIGFKIVETETESIRNYNESSGCVLKTVLVLTCKFFDYIPFYNNLPLEVISFL